MDKKSKICYDCIRKTECFTESGLKELEPNKPCTEYLNGWPCGCCFYNYEELREFIYVIGEAINNQSKKVQNNIFGYIADKYELPKYNVMIEFDRV